MQQDVGMGGVVNTHSCNVAGLLALINSGSNNAFIDNVISTYRGFPITEWNLVVAPIYLRYAVSVKAFDTCIKLGEGEALFDFLDDSSTSANLDIILYGLCEIGAKEECEWMIALKRLMPGAMFPRSPDVAREISRGLEEERCLGTGQSRVIADLCERSQNNKWDTYGCFHRWAVANQPFVLLDIYRRDVVNLLSRAINTSDEIHC